MVNVMAMIRRRKEQFRDVQRKKFQKENIKRAEDLQKLREERLRLEGRATLEKARQEEVARIDKAKQAAPSNLKKFGQGLANVMNKSRKEIKQIKGKKGKNKSGVFNKSAFTTGQGSSANFGGARPFEFGGGSGSPFNQGGKRKLL